MVFLAGCGDDPIVGEAYGGGDATTYISINTNPGVELIADQHDRIITVNGMNQDGEIVMNGNRYRGYKIDNAVKAIVQNMAKADYLDLSSEDGNAIFISVVNPDAQKETHLFYEIKTTTESYLKANGIYGMVKDVKNIVPSAIHDLASKYGISDKRVMLGLKLMELDPFLEFSDVRIMSVRNLITYTDRHMEKMSEIYSESEKRLYVENLYVAKDNYEQGIIDYYIEKDAELEIENQTVSEEGLTLAELIENFEALETHYKTAPIAEAAGLELQIEEKLAEIEVLKEQLFNSFGFIVNLQRNTYEREIQMMENNYQELSEFYKHELAISLSIKQEVNASVYKARQIAAEDGKFKNPYNQWKSDKEASISLFYGLDIV